MTGILPIKRYNSQSALNNFKEYSMLDPDGIPDSFGFTEDAALTALIHLGYLSYDEGSGKCRIPNKEIAEELIRGLKKLRWAGAYNPILESKRLLEETLKGNTDYIDGAFGRNHAELSTSFSKSSEGVPSTIVSISYCSAREAYTVLFEPSCPTGRADVLFAPKKPGYIPIVIELQAYETPEKAIEQIKDRNYASMLSGYRGKVMLLGIAYDSKTLKHHSKIEYIVL